MDKVIYETMNYEMFRKLKGNRDFASVNRIIDSINKIGYIESPILVNEKMEVIDGQNRLEALKILGLPVHYYIVEGISLDEAIQLNVGRSNWKPNDYIKGFSEKGNDNFIRLRKLIEDYKDFNPANVVAISGNTIINHGITDSYGIKNGSYKLSEDDYEAARKRMDTLRPILKCLKSLEGANRIAITGTAWTLTVEGINENKLIDKFSKEYPLFRPVATPKSFLEDLENMYNKRNNNKIYFVEVYKRNNNKKAKESK